LIPPSPPAAPRHPCSLILLFCHPSPTPLIHPGVPLSRPPSVPLPSLSFFFTVHSATSSRLLRRGGVEKGRERERETESKEERERERAELRERMCFTGLA